MLVVGSDKLSKIVDWNDRNTAVLLYFYKFPFE
ncbi:hypothetical protein ACT453_24880 [Bacillus sp. D-CC]